MYMHDTPKIRASPRAPLLRSNMTLMGIYGRRQRRSNEIQRRNGRVLVQSRVAVDLHAKATRAAAALDISMSAYLAELIARDQVDEQGQPSWTPQLVGPAVEQQPQLGLSA